VVVGRDVDVLDEVLVELLELVVVEVVVGRDVDVLDEVLVELVELVVVEVVVGRVEVDVLDVLLVELVVDVVVGWVVDELVDVVLGGTLVVVAQLGVVANTQPVMPEALPALSTAATAYELVAEPGSPVSDVDVAGASTCFQKLLLR
jgi:hypothetical protein